MFVLRISNNQVNHRNCSENQQLTKVESVQLNVALSKLQQALPSRVTWYCCLPHFLFLSLPIHLNYFPVIIHLGIYPPKLRKYVPTTTQSYTLMEIFHLTTHERK